MTTWLRSARTTRRCVPRTWGCGGGRAGPGGAGRRAIRGEVTRAARADRRGHDHASEEGHAHGRGLQTVRGEEGPPGEVPELRREPRPRARLSEDGGLPAAADAVAPQVAGGKTIPNDAKPMDLKKTVSEPARAPRPKRRARDGPRRARARGPAAAAGTTILRAGVNAGRRGRPPAGHRQGGRPLRMFVHGLGPPPPAEFPPESPQPPQAPSLFSFVASEAETCPAPCSSTASSRRPRRRSRAAPRTPRMREPDAPLPCLDGSPSNKKDHSACFSRSRRAILTRR